MSNTTYMQDSKDWKVWTGGVLIAIYCLRYAPLLDRVAGKMPLNSVVGYCNGITSAYITDCGTIMMFNFLTYLSLGIGILLIIHFFFVKGGDKYNGN